MPGPYAHITLLYELLRPDRPGPIFTPSSACHDSLETCFPFCVLGAVSPDYPNLAGGNDAQWAEAMHCFRACEMIASGIRRVRYSKGIVRAKQMAWLLGYCAHVVTDVTIHPVVEARVGVYAENQRHHRICEMNQDSHIYRRMNLGEIGASDKFALTVAQCGDAKVCWKMSIPSYQPFIRLTVRHGTGNLLPWLTDMEPIRCDFFRWPAP